MQSGSVFDENFETKPNPHITIRLNPVFSLCWPVDLPEPTQNTWSWIRFLRVRFGPNVCAQPYVTVVYAPVCRIEGLAGERRTREKGTSVALQWCGTFLAQFLQFPPQKLPRRQTYSCQGTLRIVPTLLCRHHALFNTLFLTVLL